MVASYSRVRVRVSWLIVLAFVFRRVYFDLFETARESVEMATEFSVPQPRLELKGVRLLFTSIAMVRETVDVRRYRLRCEQVKEGPLIHEGVFR